MGELVTQLHGKKGKPCPATAPTQNYTHVWAPEQKSRMRLGTTVA